MSELARKNGWRGFDNIGERVEGGYLYRCDGMPSQFGCGQELVIPRRLGRVGKKASGWLACYGIDFDGTEDKDVVLTFCPECAAVVEAARAIPASDPYIDTKAQQRAAQPAKDRENQP